MVHQRRRIVSLLDDHKEHSKKGINEEALEALFESFPEPDSFSLDYIWENPWEELFPYEGDYLHLRKDGKVIVDKSSGPLDDERWVVDTQKKLLQIEKVQSESIFEIEYTRYKVIFINAEWMVLKRTGFVEEYESSYKIFASYLPERKSPRTLRAFEQSLVKEQKSEKPNFFLLIIIIAVLIVLFVLMLSF